MQTKADPVSTPAVAAIAGAPGAAGPRTGPARDKERGLSEAKTIERARLGIWLTKASTFGQGANDR